MLTHLIIHRLAVVEHLELLFQKGMTVFSGETGAGKSILIDALALTLGERAESSMIRPGHKTAEVSAIYDIKTRIDVQSFLKKHELWIEEANDSTECSYECIIRRILTDEGRSRAFVNGIPVSIQQLKELGECLINLHSQHQHHALLKSQYQLTLLDAFGQYPELLTKVADAFNELKKAEKEYQKLNSLQTHPEKLALLDYQLQELEDLKLLPNEISELEQEHKNLSHAEQWANQCQNILNDCLDSNGNSSSILNILHQTITKIRSLEQHAPQLKNCTELFTNSAISIEEALNDLKTFQDTISVDPQRLSYVDERLSLIFALARKHKVVAKDLFIHKQNLQKEADMLKHACEHLERLSEKIQKLNQDYLKISEQLTKERKKTAEILAKQIIARLHHLELPHARFEIQFQTNKVQTNNGQINSGSELGIDTIEFMISLNPGHPLQPLRKIASGGELSRISLAIQVITAEKMTTPTLIFDEVDVGVSGKTAEIVGKLLRSLGNNTQVLCVTHLPQVAAQGHQHYKVAKIQKENNTTTQIQILNKKEKVQELARMLGGIQITESTIKHAEEMVAMVEMVI